MRTLKHYLLTIMVLTVQHSFFTSGSGPQFEQNPQYSDSYLPAAMQIIAYLTELMKYDLRPPQAAGTTTTTVRPTPAHKPGLYAPEKPLGPGAYYSRGQEFDYSPYLEFIKRLVNEKARNNDQMEARFLLDLPLDHQSIDEILKQLASTTASPTNGFKLGPGTSDLYKLINSLNDEDDSFHNQDEDVRVIKFAEKYDVDALKYVIGNPRKTPPTRAYVTLLSLYDMLNKEAKKLGLNKFNGYSVEILKDLAEISTGTSSFQLKYVLNKIVEKRNSNDSGVLKKINELLTDLGKDNSYINDALRYIPPLDFSF